MDDIVKVAKKRCQTKGDGNPECSTSPFQVHTLSSTNPAIKRLLDEDPVTFKDFYKGFSSNWQNPKYSLP